jgi:hypothetical protein
MALCCWDAQGSRCDALSDWNWLRSYSWMVKQLSLLRLQLSWSSWKQFAVSFDSFVTSMRSWGIEGGQGQAVSRLCQSSQGLWLMFRDWTIAWCKKSSMFWNWHVYTFLKLKWPFLRLSIYAPLHCPPSTSVVKVPWSCDCSGAVPRMHQN